MSEQAERNKKEGKVTHKKKMMHVISEDDNIQTCFVLLNCFLFFF